MCICVGTRVLCACVCLHACTRLCTSVYMFRKCARVIIIMNLLQPPPPFFLFVPHVPLPLPQKTSPIPHSYVKHAASFNKRSEGKNQSEKCSSRVSIGPLHARPSFKRSFPFLSAVKSRLVFKTKIGKGRRGPGKQERERGNATHLTEPVSYTHLTLPTTAEV